MTQVATLLKQAERIHKAAADLGQGRPDDVKERWRFCRELHKTAHDLDPQHTDPEWKAQKVDHDSYMLFYSQQLGPETV